MYIYLELYILYTFILYILYFNIVTIVNVKKGSLLYLFYLPLYGFCTAVHEDGLGKCRHM
jgi:hypothetical protein